MLLDQLLVHGVGIPGGDDLIPVVAQRKRQQLGDLRRVVDQQDASRQKI
jgi:hypothetical protein